MTELEQRVAEILNGYKNGLHDSVEEAVAAILGALPGTTPQGFTAAKPMAEMGALTRSA